MCVMFVFFFWDKFNPVAWFTREKTGEKNIREFEQRLAPCKARNFTICQIYKLGYKCQVNGRKGQLKYLRSIFKDLYFIPQLPR